MLTEKVYIAMDAPARDIRFHVEHGTIDYSSVNPGNSASISEWTSKAFQFRGHHLHFNLELKLTEGDLLYFYVEVVDPILDSSNRNLNMGAYAWWRDSDNNKNEIGAETGHVGSASLWYKSNNSLIRLPENEENWAHFLPNDVYDRVSKLHHRKAR